MACGKAQPTCIELNGLLKLRFNSVWSAISISFRPSLWAVLSQSNFIASAALMRVLQSVSISCVTYRAVVHSMRGPTCRDRSALRGPQRSTAGWDPGYCSPILNERTPSAGRSLGLLPERSGEQQSRLRSLTLRLLDNFQKTFGNRCAWRDTSQGPIRDLATSLFDRLGLGLGTLSFESHHPSAESSDTGLEHLPSWRTVRTCSPCLWCQSPWLKFLSTSLALDASTNGSRHRTVLALSFRNFLTSYDSRRCIFAAEGGNMRKP